MKLIRAQIQEPILLQTMNNPVDVRLSVRATWVGAACLFRVKNSFLSMGFYFLA
jgi:hypothetical protein